MAPLDTPTCKLTLAPSRWTIDAQETDINIPTGQPNNGSTGQRVFDAGLWLNEMSDADYDYFLSHAVVLDTGGPIVYLGTLHAVSPAGFILENADLHDTRSGHATPEEYVNMVRHSDISTNRRRVLVMRATVMSISRLADIVDE